MKRLLLILVLVIVAIAPLALAEEWGNELKDSLDSMDRVPPPPAVGTEGDQMVDLEAKEAKADIERLSRRVSDLERAEKQTKDRLDRLARQIASVVRRQRN